jgi:5-formyltetrahydrofolate cyclo-ligase
VRLEGSPSTGKAPATASLKADLRREMVARVRALPATELDRCADSAAESLSAFLRHEVRAGASVALYAATSTELPSLPAVRLLSDRYDLVYPRVDGDVIRFHRTRYDGLQPHASKIREPLPGDPVVQPDVVVIPARAYDQYGVRLGHGAGYYDRTVALLPTATLLIGYAFHFQLVDELPREPHDRWVHWLVTDEGTPRRCAPLPLNQA